MSVIASDVCFFRRWSSSSMAMASSAARLCNSETGFDKNNANHANNANNNDMTASHNNKHSDSGNSSCNNEAHKESIQESIFSDDNGNNNDAAATLPVSSAALLCGDCLFCFIYLLLFF